MSLRYKSIHFFITFLVLIIGVYYHKWVLLLLPILFLYYLYRFDFKFVISVCIVCGCLYFMGRPSIVNNDGGEEIEAFIEEVNAYHIIVKSKNNKLKLNVDTSNLQVGDVLLIKYQDTDFKTPRNIGGFNQKNYYYGKRVYQQGTITSYQKIDKKTSLSSIIQNYIATSNNQLVSNYTSLLLFGIKDDTMQELYSTLASLSIVHLVAISGMHFSLFNQCLEKVLGLFFTERIRNVISIIILFIYMMVLKGNVSAFRAFCMFILKRINHDYFNQLDLFGFVGLTMLTINPYYLYNLSFVYSFSLYFFLILLNDKDKSNLYLYLFSIPMICFFNFEINVLGLLFCWVMQPFIEGMYVGLLINAIFGFLFNPLISVVLTLFEGLIYFFEEISLILIVGKPGVLSIFIYYLFLFLHIYHIEVKKKSLYCLGCLFVILSLYIQPYLNNTGEITMIDVGQGDCFFVRLPFNQGNYLIDTGGLLNYDTSTGYIIPYLKSIGIKELDILFLSHDDFDHIGGKDSLLENFKVNEVVDQHDFYLRDTYVEITSLNTNQYDNENDNSLVLYFKFNGLSCLFTGDISTAVEEDILNVYPTLKVDILKIGHHGSKTSTSTKFVNLLAAKIALISVGENNFYHHPNQTVIDTLNAYGVDVYRSDQDGMVRLIFKSNKISIEKKLING